jgi:hypothetical protein
MKQAYRKFYPMLGLKFGSEITWEFIHVDGTVLVVRERFGSVHWAELYRAQQPKFVLEFRVGLKRSLRFFSVKPFVAKFSLH